MAGYSRQNCFALGQILSRRGHVLILQGRNKSYADVDPWPFPAGLHFVLDSSCHFLTVDLDG